MPMNNRLMRPGAASGPGANTLLLMRFDSSTSAGLLTDSSKYNRQLSYLSGVFAPGGFARFGSPLTGKNSAIPVGVLGVPVAPLNASRNVFPDLSLTDHTIECWVWYSSGDYGSVNSTIAHFPTYGDLTSTTGQHLYIHGMHIAFNDGMTASADTQSQETEVLDLLPYDQWFHVAAVQQGTCKRIFINGIIRAIATQPAPAGACSLSVGGYVFNDGTSITYNNVSDLYGIYIDELRFSSRALYTSNFTPPAVPFSSDSPAAAPAACCGPAGYFLSAGCNGSGDSTVTLADGNCGSNTFIANVGGCL